MSVLPDTMNYIAVGVVGIVFLLWVWVVIMRLRGRHAQREEITTPGGIKMQFESGKGNHKDSVKESLESIALSLKILTGAAPQELNGPSTRLLALADQYDATAKLFPTMTLPIVEVAKSIRGAVEEKPIG